MIQKTFLPFPHLIFIFLSLLSFLFFSPDNLFCLQFYFQSSSFLNPRYFLSPFFCVFILFKFQIYPHFFSLIYLYLTLSYQPCCFCTIHIFIIINNLIFIFSVPSFYFFLSFSVWNLLSSSFLLCNHFLLSFITILNIFFFQYPPPKSIPVKWFSATITNQFLFSQRTNSN